VRIAGYDDDILWGIKRHIPTSGNGSAANDDDAADGSSSDTSFDHVRAAVRYTIMQALRRRMTYAIEVLKPIVAKGVRTIIIEYFIQSGF
jgi:hypothetical protein